MDQLSKEDSMLINSALSPKAMSTPQRKYIFTGSYPTQFNNTEFIVTNEENLS